MKLKELLKEISPLQVRGDINIEVKGITYDSRQVETGWVFVAIRGLQDDGHKYISRALEAGASAVVYSDDTQEFAAPAAVLVDNPRQALACLAAAYYGHPSRKFRLIGVTGTNGKTSTTSLLKTIFRAADRKTGLFGTIENTLDDRVLPASHTTPESRDLQEMFRQLADMEADCCVMEVSSHALSLERVACCDFNGAVFTNLTQDHLDFHRDMEDYFQAKLKLFAMLPGDGKHYAVLNADDPASARIAASTGARVIWYGIRNPADFSAEDIHTGLTGTTFTLRYPGGKIPLGLTLTGRFSVYNCLAAVATAMEEGIGPGVIAGALSEARVSGRFEPVTEGQDFAVVVDYAHTPDSLENVLNTAREITRNRVIVVFGCGGDRDSSKRPLMGEIGVRLSDVAILTSDNPRTEDPMRILAQVEEGARRAGDHYKIIGNRREAIEEAVAMAGPGDLVLIAGKGHEEYQIIGTTRHPFSDFQVARQAISHRSSR